MFLTISFEHSSHCSVGGPTLAWKIYVFHDCLNTLYDKCLTDIRQMNDSIMWFLLQKTHPLFQQLQSCCAQDVKHTSLQWEWTHRPLKYCCRWQLSLGRDKPRHVLGPMFKAAEQQRRRGTCGWRVTTWKCDDETHFAICRKRGSTILRNSAGSITSNSSSISPKNITYTHTHTRSSRISIHILLACL